MLIRALDKSHLSHDQDELSETLIKPENQTDNSSVKIFQESSTPDSLVKLMRMFGQRSKEDLATDNRFWKSSCQLTNNKDALDAIQRAKTEQCKKELTSVACMAKVNVPFPDFIPNLCPRFSEDDTLLRTGGKPLGCFRDSFDGRILKGFVRHDWDLNSPSLCTRMCSRAGFAFSGVQYGVECFCGHDMPDKKLR